MRQTITAKRFTGLLIFFLLSQPSMRAEDDQMSLLKTFREEFVPVTPGRSNFPHHFKMGAATPATAPLHNVDIPYEFYVAKYEVTQNLWESVMGENPSRWKGPRNSVEMLSHADAKLFCQRVTKLMQTAKLIDETQAVRLPTEAEWEYFARAGTTTPYSFGEDVSKLGEFAWFHGNAAGNDPPVGAKKPNPWGLYDIHGYLSEWCEDSWHENYRGAPTNGSAWKAGDQKTKAVLRGGSWKDPANKLTSFFRYGVDKSLKDDAVGLRCVLSKKVN